MLRQWLSGTPLTALPVVGMCLFLVFFLLVLLRVSRRSRKATYDRMAALPLQDEPAERSL